ncbi:MAG: CPBP family intramembrane glutamic endopeptidase [candidate division WOR-3 bacterium]
MQRFKDLLFPGVIALSLAFSLLLAIRHPANAPPVLKFGWAFAIYFALPLSALVLLDARRRFLPYFLGILGTIAVVLPLVFRSWVPGAREFFLFHPQYLLAPVGLGVILLLIGGGVGKVSFSEWGLGLGRWRWWTVWTLVLLLLIVPLVLLAAWAFPVMREYYPVYGPAKKSLSELFKYQGGMGFYMLGWEFLFRGFLLFGMARRGGEHFAVLFQAIPFFLMHDGKPEPEMVSSFFGAIFLGYFCLKARSFWPAFILHWALNLSMEILGFFW